jgi:CBS domain containing-hemolysin-like protein
VVNEWGESVGALTIDDIRDVLFTDKPSRSERLWNREPIQLVGHGLWQAKGMTNLRLLGQYFQTALPASHSKTIGGVIQESLQRMPRANDKCRWGPFEFEVLEVDEDGGLSLQFRRCDEESDH